MSAQQWESVTWDWIEREIVECMMLTANKGPQKSESLAGLLVKRLEAASLSSNNSARQGRSSNNG